jgi:chorismate-pyruvate lyase
VDDRNPTEYASAAEALLLMVLRGDGLTTTSLEILTGREIGIRLLEQRTVRVTAPTPVQPGAVSVRSAAPDDGDGAPAEMGELELRPGEELLIRRVSLTDPRGTVYAVAEVIAVVDRLPAAVATLLFTTPTPLGKALVADGVAVTRELRRWGGYQAGRFAPMLGPTLEAASVVAGRTYRMVAGETAEPLAVVTEWFAPRLFAPAAERPSRRPRPD